MSDVEARREARRRKILQNSDNRINRLLGRPSSNDSAERVDVEPTGPELHSNRSSSQASVDDILRRINGIADPNTPEELRTLEANVRQRTNPYLGSEAQLAAELPASATKLQPEKSFSHAYQSNCVGGPQKEAATSSDPVKLLDMIRCGGCMLVAFFTRWALSAGLGILFLELVMVPFIVLEGYLYYFQATYMKEVQLPHRNSMMVYALVLSGVKPDVISRYNTAMAYCTAVTEDFAVYLFTFLLSHAVMA